MLPVALAGLVVLLLVGAIGVGLWASRRKTIVETIDLTKSSDASEAHVEDIDLEPTEHTSASVAHHHH